MCPGFDTSSMLHPTIPALVLAPMEGITDAPMRAFQGASGAFTYAVSEFIRVSSDAITPKLFQRDVPELLTRATTVTGLPVQVQILGGDPDLMAESALAASEAGAPGVDINFGCPAKTVNRHDGGASLLKHPTRIRDIVRAVRDAVPRDVPVSAKLRLGWDAIESIHENAAMAAEGGASWLTIHARTRAQGYLPPVFWPELAKVRESLGIPIVANGDIWNIDDFHRCREETGCIHYMIGRGALANPFLPIQIAQELGILRHGEVKLWEQSDWPVVLKDLDSYSSMFEGTLPMHVLLRFKQWLKLARNHGDFRHFDAVKQADTLSEFYERLAAAMAVPG